MSKSSNKGGANINKTTVALSKEQYKNIISTMRLGFAGMRPNPRVATALMLEANLGLRVSDIVQLRLDNIVLDGERYRLAITEQKTGKTRTFTVPIALYQFIKLYCIENEIKESDLMFPITTKAIQKVLKATCDYLGYSNIGTHSFRKFYATEIYKDSNYNIALVQHLLQHSSAAVAQRYKSIFNP